MLTRLLTILFLLASPLPWGGAGFGPELSRTGGGALRAQTTDPFPDVNPHAYYGSMIMSLKTRIFSEVPLQDIIVAVYAGDEIRAKGRPSANNPGVTYLTIYGDTSGEPLHFKVYVKEHIIEADPDLTYTLNGIVGTPQSPYVLELGQYIPHSGITVQSTEDHHTATFDGNSEEPVDIPIPLTFDHIEYNRDFVPGRYACVFFPFPVTEDMTITGGKFYRFTDIRHEDDEWKAIMTEVHELEANRPYLFVPEATRLTIDSNGQKITMMTAPVASDTRNGWTFHGTYEKLQWTGEGADYGFPANRQENNPRMAFERFINGDYILPLHCYLTYTGEDFALPAFVTINLGDDETSLTPIPSPVGEGSWYDLSGRKIPHSSLSTPTPLFEREGSGVSLLPKGIYIVSGRKIIVQ